MFDDVERTGAAWRTKWLFTGHEMARSDFESIPEKSELAQIGYLVWLRLVAVRRSEARRKRRGGAAK